MRRPLSGELVAHVDPKGAAAEAFRVLRTNLQFMGLDAPLKSLLVTSAAPSEGKSTVAANLAVSFAQAGQNVCLVDADLRKPRLHKIFGAENWRGLTTAVMNQNGIEADLQFSGIEGLMLLTSGPIPPNPAELLGSGRMQALLGELEQRFDVVVLDSPPVLAVADAVVLAPRVSGVILVVRAGQAARQQVKRAQEALLAVKANLLGVVLDGVKNEDRSGGYYYYYYYGDSGKRSNG